MEKESYLCSVLLNYNTMLKLENVGYSYPGSSRSVISNFSLELTPGKIYGLLGANGTGKSTLLYLMSGLLTPHTGAVTFNGVNTALKSAPVLSEIFLVPEEIELPAVSLQQYVKLNAPFYPRFDYEELNRLLEHFRLQPDIHLGALSMGQKKKAFIAFALACNTKVLLMDEPTNGLDIPGKSEFRRAVVSAMNDDRTLVISTHQVRDLDRVLDHVIIIDNEGPRLISSIADLQERWQFLFTTNPADLEGCIWSEPVPGGYQMMRRREADQPETDVNLESLFQVVFTNPQLFAKS